MPNNFPNFEQESIPWHMTDRPFFGPRNSRECAVTSFGLTEGDLSHWRESVIAEVGTGGGRAAQELVQAGYNLVATIEPGLLYQQQRDRWLETYNKMGIGQIVVPCYAADAPQHIKPEIADIVFALGCNFQYSCGSEADFMLQHIGILRLLKLDPGSYLTYWRNPNYTHVFRKFRDGLNPQGEWDLDSDILNFDNTLSEIGAKYEYHGAKEKSIRLYRLNDSGQDIVPSLIGNYYQAKLNYPDWGIEYTNYPDILR